MTDIEKKAEEVSENIANECVAFIKDKIKESVKYAYLNGSEDCFQIAKKDIKELLYYVDDNEENAPFRKSMQHSWGLNE